MPVDYQALLPESQVPPGRTDPRRYLRHRETLLPDRDEAAAHCGCADYTLLHANGKYCGTFDLQPFFWKNTTLPFWVRRFLACL